MRRSLPPKVDLRLVSDPPGLPILVGVLSRKDLKDKRVLGVDPDKRTIYFQGSGHVKAVIQFKHGVPVDSYEFDPVLEVCAGQSIEGSGFST